MNIPINKDFEAEYKQNVWKGFSLRELKYIVMGLVLAGASGAFLIFIVDLNEQLAIFAAIGLVIPVVMLGFWKSPNGLSLRENQRAKEYRKNTRILIYRAREYRSYEPKEEQPHRGFSKKDIRKMRRVHKKYVNVQLKKRRKEAKRNGIHDK